jgi:hypothetical protein
VIGFADRVLPRRSDMIESERQQRSKGSSEPQGIGVDVSLTPKRFSHSIDSIVPKFVRAGR